MNCQSVEVAFDLGGLNIGRGHGAAIALPCLANLEGCGLPNLTHVWANYSPTIQGFQNLRSFNFYYCGRLRILFTPFIAKLLVRLQELKVTTYFVMEAIVAGENQTDDDDVRPKTIIFPELTTFVLKDLPNLVSFCPQAYEIEESFENGGSCQLSRQSWL